MLNKVELMLNELKNYDLVISDASICDSELMPTKGSHFKLHKVKTGFVENFTKTRYIGACMAFDRKLLDRILPLPKNKIL